MKLIRSMNWRWGAGAVVAGTLILVACEGSNLFENDQFFDQTIATVTASVTPTVTSPGSTIQISVHATDNIEVTRIGYAVLEAGDTIGGAATLVPTSGATKDTTFSFVIPATVTAGSLQVIGIAQDASGRRGYSSPITVTLADSAAPVITINAPATGSTLPLNDSVRVNIRVQDPSGIKSIRLRGESTRVDSLGPTRVVQRFAEKTITFPINPGGALPTDTTITRYLLAIPDSISEPVQILVTAVDSLNNTAVASTTILVGGPRVELRNPTNGRQVTPGGTLLLTAFAVDRSAGIDSVQFNVSGAQTATIKYCNAAHCLPMSPSNDSILINHNYIVGPTLGTVTITATAWNRNRVAGQSSQVNVVVASTAVVDTARPQVRVSMTPNDRVQLSDVLTVNVAAQDNGASGLRRMGIIVTATPGGTGVAPDTVFLDSVFTGSGRTGLQPATFTFTLASLGFTETMLVQLPRSITFHVNAFAVDTIGNTGCNVTNTLAALPCDSIMPPLAPQKFFITRGTIPASQLVTVVPGFSVPLPTPGSKIADLIVDMNPARPRMYLSNLNNNRVDVLCLTACGAAGDSTFADAISVGSEPWGMTIDNTGTRLMVANSGGTNISMVDITSAVGSIREVAAERILTPNAVLFDVRKVAGQTTVGYEWTAYDFSDRPQFVAQDASGVILHSTKPTGSAPDGTVRYLHPAPGSPRPFESKILYTQDAIDLSVDTWAVAHLDSIGTQDFTLYDHRTGDPTPSGILSAPILGPYELGCDNPALFPDPLDRAFCSLKQQGSDVDVHRGGRWDLAEVGLSDTTYVTTSTDRDMVAFGEGGVGPFASIWLWRCDRPMVSGNFACANDTDPEPGVLSDWISVGDLVGNAAERVLGISLNSNGTIGGARGSQSAYFFSNGVSATGDLRLQGVYANGVANASGGMALHPSHPDPVVSTCDETSLAFISTGNRSIRITDTFHFRDRGEIQIRDNIVGPLRAALPLASENVGLSAADTILVKLYGLTGAGNAIIINVRRRDLVNMAGGVCQ